MYERKSKPRDSKICDVTGCKKNKKQAVPENPLKEALPEMKYDSEGKNIQLCKDHYKEFKKATKDDREMNKLRKRSRN